MVVTKNVYLMPLAIERSILCWVLTLWPLRHPAVRLTHYYLFCTSLSLPLMSSSGALFCLNFPQIESFSLWRRQFSPSKKQRIRLVFSCKLSPLFERRTHRVSALSFLNNFFFFFLRLNVSRLTELDETSGYARLSSVLIQAFSCVQDCLSCIALKRIMACLVWAEQKPQSPE